jgi:hypothetical protein
VAVVFVVEVGDVAICCFVLVLRLEDVQLLHEELLLVFYLGQVRPVLGVVGISVLCYVLSRVVVILLSALCSAQAVAAAVVLLDTRLAVVRLQARSGVA